MTAIHLKVTTGKVICHDRESDSPYDAFALTGIVIVDNQPHTFALDTAAANEKIAIVLPTDGPLFEGGSQSTSIGLVLRAYDIDDNDKWRDNREEIIRRNNQVADIIAEIPVGGDTIASVVRAWPKVVDAFVDLDKDDLLLDVGTTIELPPPSDLITAPPMSYTFRARGRGNIPLISSWDYEVSIRFEYVSADPVLFPEGTPKVTYEPTRQELRSQWIGDWEASVKTVEPTAPPVRVNVRPSTHGTGLDVTVTERHGREKVSQFVDVAVPHGAIAPEFKPGQVQQAVNIGEAEVPLLPDLALPPEALQRHARLGRGGVHEAQAEGPAAVLAAAEKEKSLADKVIHEMGDIQAANPFGTDVLLLGDEAVLEMYRVVVDGRATGDNALRYRRPIGGADQVAVIDPVNELLHRVSD
ncbi:MAG: hypothetical protein WA726_05905 [Acidimicrobiia bacterium]